MATLRGVYLCRFGAVGQSCPNFDPFMSSTVFKFPLGFSWLSPAYHPLPEEVDTYAAMIAAREGDAPECADLYRREAELQLWVWRAENRRRPTRRRSSLATAMPT